jgi:hypothetical protein
MKALRVMACDLAEGVVTAVLLLAFVVLSPVLLPVELLRRWWLSARDRAES